MCQVLRSAGIALDNDNDNDDLHSSDSKESKYDKSKKSSANGRESMALTSTQLAIIQLLAQLLPVMNRDAAAIIVAAVRPDNTG
jgi:hypothetical protein